MGFPVGTKVFIGQGLRISTVVKSDTRSYTTEDGDRFRSSDDCTWGMDSSRHFSRKCELWTPEEEKRRVDALDFKLAVEQAESAIHSIENLYNSRSFHFENKEMADATTAEFNKLKQRLSDWGVLP